MNFKTIESHVTGPVCTLRLQRPDAGNAINGTMVTECRQVLATLPAAVHIVVVEGAAEVFCLGADFEDVAAGEKSDAVDPAALYALWSDLALGPFISLAHVRGKAQAGGVGFAAACDIVLANQTAEFGLPELLFSLFPACVLPFLIRRIGFQKAHYLTLTTKPIGVREACDWGLVDAHDANSEDLLRKHLLRLRRLPKAGIQRYKAYASGLAPSLALAREPAIAANRAVFADPTALDAIRRFTQTGHFPWED
jgi:polyketide biosynthesis enoyl-CoA hydratase PksH